MKQFIYFVILMVCAVLLDSCEHMKRPITDNVVETDTVEQFEYYVPTVYDVLEQRQELIYSLWVDSIYFAMPEQILTHILVTKGTTQSVTDIVEDYIANKTYYHDTILKSMNIQKKYIPDSLPQLSKPDKILNKNDTVNKNINNQ